MLRQASMMDWRFSRAFVVGINVSPDRDGVAPSNHKPLQCKPLQGENNG
jgi:hypothetical protein